MEPEDDNPYQAPSSRIDVPASEGPNLASRGNRFGGYLIDRFIVAVILFPFQWATGFWQSVAATFQATHRLPVGQYFMWDLIGLAVFVLVQAYPLVTSGQTLGKKMVHTRIVTMDGRHVPAGPLLVRYAILKGIGLIPFVRLGLLIDVLMIYRRDRRCGHDFAAGTQVIDVFVDPDEPGLDAATRRG